MHAEWLSKQYVISKSSLIKDKYDSINFEFGSDTAKKYAWGNVKILKTSLAPTRRPTPTKMRREDGSITVTYVDGVEIFAKHFQQLYGHIPAFDPSILDLLPQIAKSVSRLRATSPGVFGTHARMWQALTSTPEGFNYIKHCILHFWATENPPKGWEMGLLAILPKKGI